MPLCNHQATDSKKNKFTIIDLASADPYLPDRIECELLVKLYNNSILHDWKFYLFSFEPIFESNQPLSHMCDYSGAVGAMQWRTNVL